MPSYEIRLDGLIGPMVISALPGFTPAQDSADTTVLTGTADLQGLMALFETLNAHGFTPIDIAINHPDPGGFVGPEQRPPTVHHQPASAERKSR